jgi:hypothetical protein
MSYFLAPALVTLRDEVNRQFPNRSKRSDGWIGDASHQARRSDHNPCWYCTGRMYGIVRALDIDVNDGNPTRNLRVELIKALVGDSRVWYVISNGVIYSRTHNFQPRKYTGSNPHFTHVHVSLRHNHAEFSTARWLSKPKAVRINPLPIRLSIVQDEFKAVLLDGARPTQRVHVRRVQRALNDKYPQNKIKADGYVGPETFKAWRAHERLVGGAGRPAVPDTKSLKRLVQPRYTFQA